jgi:hypothetical protein
LSEPYIKVTSVAFLANESISLELSAGIQFTATEKNVVLEKGEITGDSRRTIIDRRETYSERRKAAFD